MVDSQRRYLYSMMKQRSQPLLAHNHRLAIALSAVKSQRRSFNNASSQQSLCQRCADGNLLHLSCEVRTCANYSHNVVNRCLFSATALRIYTARAQRCGTVWGRDRLLLVSATSGLVTSVRTSESAASRRRIQKSQSLPDHNQQQLLQVADRRPYGDLCRLSIFSAIDMPIRSEDEKEWW